MRQVLIIVPENGMLFEATGIADILEHANRLSISSGNSACYAVQIATTHQHRTVHGRSGLCLLANSRIAEIDPNKKWDTIVVTSRGLGGEDSSAVAGWLRKASKSARRVVSICGGALLLAQAGLLDGKRATTHWRLLDTLQSSYPKIQVQKGPIYIEDGKFWTSAGVSSGFDLTLALVENDLGFEISRDIAQDLVMFLRRPGTQSQFSQNLLNQARTPGPIRELQSWIHENLALDLSVDVLARRLNMSLRNFSRIFMRETGLSPAKFVEEVRLSYARQRLEQSRDKLEKIAIECGFGNGLSLRRVFEKNLGVTPSEYRSRFHSLEMAESDR